MYYKVLDPDGTSPVAHTRWFLPTGDQPGGWMPKITGKLVRCKNGYHALPPTNLTSRVFGGAHVYEVELGGDSRSFDREVVASRMRLVRLVGVATPAVLRAWACDCAERALPPYEGRYPGEGSVRSCVGVVRRYLAGEADAGEVRAAADAIPNAGYYTNEDNRIAGETYVAGLTASLSHAPDDRDAAAVSSILAAFDAAGVSPGVSVLDAGTSFRESATAAYNALHKTTNLYATAASTTAALRGALSRVGAHTAQIARRAALASANMVLFPSITTMLVHDVGGWVDLTALYTHDTSLSWMTWVLRTKGDDGASVVEDTRARHEAMLAEQAEGLLAHIAKGQ